MIQIKKIIKVAGVLGFQRFRFCKDKDLFGDVNQSKYYQPKFKVSDFLARLSIENRSGGDSFRIKECLFCHKHHNNDLTNLYTLIVDKQTGVYYCHRCQSKGSWSQFQAKYLNLTDEIVSLKGNIFEDSVHSESEREPMSDLTYFIFRENLKKQEYADVKDYIISRGFTEETIEKYQIGAGQETFVSENGQVVKVKVIYFPMFQFDGKSKSQIIEGDGSSEVKLVKLKVRGASSESKMFARQIPAGPKSGFFGLNTIQDNDKFIVITEGEFDAMAVHQETGYPAISLPQGANSLPDHLLPMLDRFERIYLWMDNDEAGRMGQDKIGHKLGSKRTYIVKHDKENLKDANDFLRRSPNEMKDLISKSKNKAEENIMVFDDFLLSVKRRILKEQEYSGWEIDFLPFFNKHIKGIRPKELSVVSGPTGCGKTTFLSQLSLDISKKKVPVLWGSFEILNEVLLTNMLTQYAGLNLFKNKDALDYHANKFRELPLYFLNFQDSINVELVLATIEYSIEHLGVGLVIIDTLQFFLSNQAEGFQRFDLQDRVMSRLRKMATNHSVHIIVVIHPRKTDDGEDIQISSVYGSSKATQEADNVWIIQNRTGFRVFDVKKNRYDGDVGKVGLGYSRETKSFFQLKKDELRKIFGGEATSEEIAKERLLENTNGEELKFDMVTGGEESQDQDILIRQSRKFTRK